jgi:hypothetical protein
MKVTVRNLQYPFKDRFPYPMPEFYEYEGEEVTLKHVDSKQYLCLTTGLEDFKIRVIDRNLIIKSQPHELFILDEFVGAAERRIIEGSKGNIYELYKINGKWSCTCPGYEFRKTCKHVKEVK